MSLKPIRNHPTEQPPIYEIVMVQHCDNVDKYECPDLGIVETVGYYYEYETAVRALHENWADIQDCCFRAAFIEMKYPGLYPDVAPEQRQFFRWDNELEGFFEAEEPKFMEHFGGP